MNKYNCKPTCPPIAAPVEVPVLFNRTLIDAARGDETGPEAPYVGKFRNTLVVYEASDAIYLFSSDGNFTFLGYGFSQMTEEAVRRLITEAVGAEARIREDADDALGGRIGTVESGLSEEISARTNADNVLRENIATETSARTAADEALSASIATEETARINADNALSASIAAEATARDNADTLLRNAIDAEISNRIAADTTLQNNITAETTARGSADVNLQNQITATDTAINKTVITDLVVDPTTSTTVVELDATKTNIKTSTTATDSIPLPVASATQAGVMNAATFNAIARNTQDIANIKGQVVAITGLPANPTQQELTTAWINTSGEPALINGAGIYDVTNAKRWTYYANDTTWHSLDASGSVQVNQWTNAAAGIVKGSTNNGQIFAESDGTGSVNGWDTLSGQVATNTSKLATIEQGAQENVQSNWTESDPTSDAYIQNKPTVDTTLNSSSNNAISNAAVTTKLEDASFIGSTIGQPSSLAYVGSANIQDGAVTTDKIAALNVTEGKLASNSVTTNKIADGSVTSDKIDYTTIDNFLAPSGSISGAGYNPNNVKYAAQWNGEQNNIDVFVPLNIILSPDVTTLSASVTGATLFPIGANGYAIPVSNVIVQSYNKYTGAIVRITPQSTISHSNNETCFVRIAGLVFSAS